MSTINLRHLSKNFGSFRAVDDLSLEIADGELIALLGPSGCGKTTTLRMIAGFVEASSGQILFGDRPVTNVPPNKRNTGMVFQRYALFPHLTVAQNVIYGLEMRNIPRRESEARVSEALDQVRLRGLENRLPKELSGGQQQRVALARALVIRPDVLLLDEPLSNLDAKLRNQVRVEIRQLQQSLSLTTIFVTHDQEEALSVADRLVVMNGGKIEQVGRPADLYERPATAFVADFIGKSNFFKGQLQGDRFLTDFGASFGVRDDVAAASIAPVLAVRPEKITLANNISKEPNQVAGTIETLNYLGPVTEYFVRLGSGQLIQVQRQNASATHSAFFDVGAQVTLGWSSEDSIVL